MESSYPIGIVAERPASLDSMSDILVQTMTVRTNRAMLDLLGGDPEFLEPNFVPVPEQLLRELSSGFKEVHGRIVPTSFEGDMTAEPTLDETGFECLLSKTYIQDFVTPDAPLSELCRVGLAYGFYLRRAISESAVHGDFRFIVDAQLQSPDGPEGNACSVRFHKLRPDQPWLSEDLESYTHNALLVMDWSKVPSRD
jgi:hypothetical protein